MSLLDKRIEDYRENLPAVGYNALKRDDILTFRDLVRLTEQEVLRTPNLGRGSLNSIKELLCAQEPQLRLGMTTEEIEKLDASPEEPPGSVRAQEILRALARILVLNTSADGLGQLMTGTRPTASYEPTVRIALDLRHEAGMTVDEYRDWLTPPIADALTKRLGAKVTIE